MELNKLVFGALSLGCLAAAAAGGYLANSQRGSSAAVAVESAAPTATSADAAAGKPVAESEGVIAPEPSTAKAESPAEATPTAPRREAASRPAQTTRRPERRAEAAPTPTRPARTESASRESAPSSSGSSASGSMWETRPAIEPERAPVVAEPEPPAAPAEPEKIDLVVPAESVLGLQIERTVTSEVARVEDRVEARVTRDVRVGDRVAIPAGSVVQGSVMEVERGGKVKEKARLGIRFHTVVLADGSRLSIRTDSVVREGTSPTGESAAKIGGAAVGGAILGAILGGGKGAAIGGGIGAAGGTAATMAGGRNPAVLPAGTTVSVRVQQPVTVTVEKD
jgi:hypothetical protein